MLCQLSSSRHVRKHCRCCYATETDPALRDAQIGAFFGDDDELDPGEAFERAQAARIMATNPDSGAFHAARKKLTTATAGTGGRHTGRS